MRFLFFFFLIIINSKIHSKINISKTNENLIINPQFLTVALQNGSENTYIVVH